MAIIFRSNTALTNPNPSTPIIPAPNPVILSDSFDRPNGSLVNVMADAALGGTPTMWNTAESHSPYVVDNQLGSNATGSAIGAYLPVSVNDIEVSVLVKAPSNVSATRPMLGARALNTFPDVNNTAYRLRIGETVLEVQLRKAGQTDKIISTYTNPLGYVGCRVALRCVGSRISVLVDGQEVKYVVDDNITGGGYVYLGQGIGAVNTWRIDDLIVRAIDTPDQL